MEYDPGLDAGLEDAPPDAGGALLGGAPEGASDDEAKAAAAAKKKRRVFTEADLVGPKGLMRLREDFPKRVKPCTKGWEREWLRHLMFLYKEWGYELYPALAFEDLAARIETLGSKGQVRNHLAMMRDDERDRCVRERHGEDAVQVVRRLGEAAESAKRAKKNKRQAAEEERAAPINGAHVASRYADGSDDSSADEGDLGGGGGGGGGSAGAAAAPAPAAAAPSLPDEVLRRIEANRRQALERLQKMKQDREAAAAAPADATDMQPTGSGSPAQERVRQDEPGEDQAPSPAQHSEGGMEVDAEDDVEVGLEVGGDSSEGGGLAPLLAEDADDGSGGGRGGGGMAPLLALGDAGGLEVDVEVELEVGGDSSEGGGLAPLLAAEDGDDCSGGGGMAPLLALGDAALEDVGGDDAETELAQYADAELQWAKEGSAGEGADTATAATGDEGGAAAAVEAEHGGDGGAMET